MMPRINVFSTQLFDVVVHNGERVMIYNRTIQCQAEKDGFPFEYGSSLGFFLMHGN